MSEMRRLRQMKTRTAPLERKNPASAVGSGFGVLQVQKNMSRDGLPSRSTSAELLRLFEIPFSTLMSDVSSLQGPTEEYISSRLAAAAGIAEAATVSGANLRESIKLIYSEETLRGLRTGKYGFVADAKTKFRSAVPTDAKRRIVEHPKVEHARSLVNSALFGAALLASVETERQLISINRKLDRLIDLAESERDGRLRGAYESLARNLSLSDPERRARSLERALETLHELSGIFYEGATRTLASIRDPEAKGFIEDVVSWPRSEKRKLEENLASALADFKRLRLCWFLQRLVVSALDDPAELRMVIMHQSESLAEIKESLVQRVRYLNPEGAADLSEQLNRAIGDHREDLVRIGRAIETSRGIGI